METHSKPCYKNTPKVGCFLFHSSRKTAATPLGCTLMTKFLMSNLLMKTLKKKKKNHSEPPSQWGIELPKDLPPHSFAWWLLCQ